MNTTTKEIKLTKIVADEGMWLTQASEEIAERSYTKELYLSATDSVDNWKEITEEQKVTYQKAEEERRKAEEEAHKAKMEAEMNNSQPIEEIKE